MDLLQIVDEMWICTKKLDVACKAVGNTEAFPGIENVSSFLNDVYDDFYQLLREITKYQSIHKYNVIENECMCDQKG